MRWRSRVIIAAIGVGLILAALVFPIGPLGCGGLDCFTVGPFSKAIGGSGGIPASTKTAAIVIVFPGTATYSDGSTQPISSQQSAFAVVYGPNGKQLSKIDVGIRLQISTNTNLTIGLSGFYDEIASRPSSSPLGAYYKQIAHTTVTQTYSLRPSNVTVYLANVTHGSSDLQLYSDIGIVGDGTSSSFNYALAGFLNFTISQPIGKVVNVMLAWPTLPIAVTAPGAPPPPPSGGTYPRCTRYYCVASVIGAPAGARYSWYVLGTVVPLQFVTTPTDARSVLADLGLI